MTAGDETLLGRLLRYLAGIDAIAHAGPDSYVATTTSKAFTTAKGISGSGLFVNCLIPTWTKLPKTLAESGYGNPDLAQTIEQITAGPAMEHMVHDFFTLQPVKGAHAYYFRSIFHDWPDKQCRAILQQTCTAMAKGFSKILINEMVVPLQGGDLFALQSDINMMSVAAGMERTEKQWHELLNSVGLEIVRIWTKDSDSESIIEAMLL
ncbi:MAG: hypothetical protein ASARMPREDX12_004609 [Alectoria sarmentosa]|nr:MAG: hypothetical protein ASARMPREDX12_004609 [Alectoria sarmentosa]